MNFADYTGPGRPFRGSTAWAAAQIERLLEEEERRRRMGRADAQRHPARPSRWDTPGHRSPSSDFDTSSARAIPSWTRADDVGASVAAPALDDAADPNPQPDRGPTVINRAPRYRGELMPGLRSEPFLNNQETAELALSAIPLIGDVYGLYRDIEMFRDDPDSRTLGNLSLAAVGLIPYVPSAMARFARTGKLTDEAGKQIPDLESLGLRRVRNRHGRRGDPFTQEVVQVAEQGLRTSNPTWQHLAGGTLGEIATAGPGRRLGEHLSPPSKDGRAGSRFADLLFFDPDREKFLAFQIVRTDRRGEPLLDEQLAARDLARRGIDVYYVFPPRL